jgi:hypothetical protein
MYQETLNFCGPDMGPPPYRPPYPNAPYPNPPYYKDPCFDPENLYCPPSPPPVCNCGKCAYCKGHAKPPRPPVSPMPCPPPQAYCPPPAPCPPPNCWNNFLHFCNQKVILQMGCLHYKVIVLGVCGNFLVTLACCNGKKAYFNLAKVDSITPLN